MLSGLREFRMETFSDFLHDLRRNPDSGAEFSEDCLTVFSDAAGRRVARTLCKFRNPFFSPMQGVPAEALEMAFRAGQQDVVTTLVFKAFPPEGSSNFNPHSTVKTT